MALEDTKSFLASKTFWSGLLGIITSGVAAYSSYKTGNAEALNASLGGIATSIGAILFRISATKKIG